MAPGLQDRHAAPRGLRTRLRGRVETLNASLAALSPALRRSAAGPRRPSARSTDEWLQGDVQRRKLRAALVPGRLRRVCRLLAVDFDTFEYPLPDACAPARSTAGRTLGTGRRPTPPARLRAGGALNESAVTYPPLESAAAAPASGGTALHRRGRVRRRAQRGVALRARVPRRRGDPKLFATVLSRSTDGGATFRAPTELAAVRGSMSHNLAVLAPPGAAAAEPVLLLIGGRTGFPPGANYSAEPAPLRPGWPPAGRGRRRRPARRVRGDAESVDRPRARAAPTAAQRLARRLPRAPAAHSRSAARDRRRRRAVPAVSRVLLVWRARGPAAVRDGRAALGRRVPRRVPAVRPP